VNDLARQHAKNLADGFGFVAMTASECVYGKTAVACRSAAPGAVVSQICAGGVLESQRPAQRNGLILLIVSHAAALQRAAAAIGKIRNPGRQHAVRNDLTATDSRLVEVHDARAHLVASIDGVQLAGWTGTDRMQFESAVRDLIAKQGKDLHRPAMVDIKPVRGKRGR
jgi:hypothetical protein